MGEGLGWQGEEGGNRLGGQGQERSGNGGVGLEAPEAPDIVGDLSAIQAHSAALSSPLSPVSSCFTTSASPHILSLCPSHSFPQHPRRCLCPLPPLPSSCLWVLPPNCSLLSSTSSTPELSQTLSPPCLPGPSLQPVSLQYGPQCYSLHAPPPLGPTAT